MADVPRPSGEEVKAAVRELDRVRDEWMRRPEVTAVDVGLHRVGASYTGGVAIRVFVRSLADLGKGAFPERLGRFPVIVSEGEFGLEAERGDGGERDARQDAEEDP